MFEKRHYKKIAEVLSHKTNHTLLEDITLFKEMLADDNPRFNPEKFESYVKKLMGAQ